MCQKWEELQDPSQEEIVRLNVIRLECDKVEVHQSVLGELQCLIEQLQNEGKIISSTVCHGEIEAVCHKFMSTTLKSGLSLSLETSSWRLC